MSQSEQPDVSVAVDEAKPANETVERMIADYLRGRPDFFNRHVDLLEALRIPHPCQPAVSLIERQLLRLRQQNGQLRKKLRELVKIARENDCLSKRMQQLNLVLIEAGQFDDMVAGIQSVLREEFSADFTALTFSAGGGARLDAAGLMLFAPVFESGRPLCGRLTEQQLTALFQGTAPQVSSCALVPLSGFGWKGLIAIGSRDARRFHAGMGTLFLSRIGELVSHALAPHLNASETA